MDKNKFAALDSLILALICALGATRQLRAQDDKAPYPSMAPVDQYLMADRDAEIALARSAAPESISRDATILVLGRHGYETAVDGKNGFVCGVERSWLSPFGDANFWNTKIRAALCYNPAAVRSILPIVRKKTEWALAGLPMEQVMEKVASAYAKKEFPPLEQGAMCYMMSKGSWLDGGGNQAHVMFYVPLDANWGASLPGSPVVLIPEKPPDRFTILIIAVRQWSDGTSAN